MGRHERVLHKRKIRNGAAPKPLFRNETQPELPPRVRRLVTNRLADQPDGFVSLTSLLTRQHTQQLLLAVAGNPRYTDDLTRT